MLDDTLVVNTGEFGRTPRMNEGGGRDHWPNVYTTVLAGGGMRGGHVHGSSDNLGAEVDTFLACIAAGTAPEVDGLAGVAALEVAERIQAAIRDSVAPRPLEPVT